MRFNLFYILVALGVVAIGAGAYFGIQYIEKQKTVYGAPSNNIRVPVPSILPRPTILAPTPKPTPSAIKATLSVPTRLAVTNTAPHQVTLSWLSSGSKQEIAGYRIYRDGVEIGTSVGTKYASINLQAETKYEYSVSAFDGAGNISLQTRPVVVTTRKETVASISPTKTPAASLKPTQIPAQTGGSVPTPTLTQIQQEVVFRAADLNRDGRIDISDYSILIGDFNKTADFKNSRSDINKDGIVDVFDYNALVENFNK